jgi:hypothetical protein
MVMTTNNGTGGSNATSVLMKKYLVIKATVINSESVNPGDVVEIEESIGNELVYYGKVEEHTGKSKKTDRSVGLESSEVPAPKKRTKS